MRPWLLRLERWLALAATFSGLILTGYLLAAVVVHVWRSYGAP